jgi:hypothetical protein
MSGAITVVVVIAVVLAVAVFFSRQRTKNLTNVALQMGFKFERKKWSDPKQAPHLETALFAVRGSKHFENIMSGASGNLRASIFDYLIVEGKTRFAQTVATFTQDKWFPTFSLQPKGLLQKMSEAIKHRDLKFDSNPAFSERWQLRGTDEPRLRAVFTGTLLSYLEGLDPAKKWHIEGTSGTLILYRWNRKVKPADIRTFLDESSAIANNFFALADLRSTQEAASSG